MENPQKVKIPFETPKEQDQILNSWPIKAQSLMRENIKQKDEKPKTGGSYPPKDLRLFSKMIILPFSNILNYYLRIQERVLVSIF